MAVQRTILRWIAPALALAAVLFLPALRVTAPLLRPMQWSCAQLAAELLPAASNQAGGLRGLMRQARALDSQLGLAARGGRPNRRLDAALALAAAIPAAALLAGVCALLCLGLQFWRRRSWFLSAAGVGLASTAYAVAASWWLTGALQLRLDRLLAGSRWSWIQSQLSPVGVVPQAGLYILDLAYLAMLLLPEDG